jgi:hypothetical protein
MTAMRSFSSSAKSALALRFTCSSTSLFTHFPSAAPGGAFGDRFCGMLGERRWGAILKSQ